ncbi:glycosyltransferase family 2 protein [Chryseolinea sp. T2]|uniref:glycosyltransferase family 2 protein n=1 Tax=Chryseolinea sp. T2 TaxID=3129255 RepID=UPI0030779C5E
MLDLSISIVVFKNNPDHVRQAIESALDNTINLKIFLVDNSPTDSLRALASSPKVEYLFNGANLGFGKAHNLVMQKAVDTSKYHLVLNPDVYFGKGTLDKLFHFMEANPDVGHVMPQILYPDGRIQHLCKLLPSPIDLVFRRFFPWMPGAASRNEIYELRPTGYNKIMNIPFLSGCFMFLRCSVLKEVGFFEEKIFMYVEDVDLSRRIHLRKKTIFYPEAQINHYYHKGSYKNLKLMFFAIHGAFIYFNKWGWFFDRQRQDINRRVLSQYLPEH